MKVTIYEPPDGALGPDEPLVFRDIDNLAFVNNESYGPAKNFGHGVEGANRTLLVNIERTVAVVIS